MSPTGNVSHRENSGPMGDVRWKLGRSIPFPSVPPSRELLGGTVSLHEPPRNICGAVSVAHPGAAARMVTRGLTPSSILPCLAFLSLALNALGLQPK